MAFSKAARVRMSDGLQVLPHHLDDALAGQVGHLLALAVGRRDGRAAGQAHAQRLGERVHGRGRAHGVAVAGRRRRRGHQLQELLVVDLAARHHLARLPHDGAGAGALALVPAVEHRPARQHDGRDIDGRRRHDLGRRGLVAAGGEHDAVDRIAVEHLDQRQVGEVAVERRGRALAGFLDRMDRKLEGDAAGLADAFAHALGEVEVMAVAGRQVGAGLGDADDRLARLQLLQRQAEVHGALEVERGHVGVGGIVEPGARAQVLRLHLVLFAVAVLAVGFCHWFLPRRPVAGSAACLLELRLLSGRPRRNRRQRQHEQGSLDGRAKRASRGCC